MPEYPYFATRLDAARFLLHENREPELWFADLDPHERELLLQELRTKRWRMRRRALGAHLIGVTLTVCFLGLGVAVMTIGPAEFLGAFDAWGLPTVSGQAAHWGVLVVLAALGGFTADYVLRRRLKIARLWGHEADSIREAIRRGEGRHPPSDSSSPGSEVAATADDAAPLHAAITVLREHTHYSESDMGAGGTVRPEHTSHLESHYLIERLTDLARGGLVTAEAQTALQAAARRLLEECGARTEADALQRWIEMRGDVDPK